MADNNSEIEWTVIEFNDSGERTVHKEQFKNQAHSIVKKAITSALQLKKELDIAQKKDIPLRDIDELLIEEYANPKSPEYLVDGAILTCSICTNDKICILDDENKVREYSVKEDLNIDLSHEGYDKKVFGKLTVTENPKAEVTGLRQATIADSRKEKNIPYFGNCMRTPKSEAELMKYYERNCKEPVDLEIIREEGTCRCLMRLDNEWENGIIGQANCSFTIASRVSRPGITMTSILFCKHGGIIFPVQSGQMITNADNEEEPEEEQINQLLSEPDISNPQAVKEYMWFFFRSKGLSEFAVAGILGNVSQESWGFDLQKASVMNSARFGLFQWSSSSSDDRRKAFDEWVKENGRNINLVSTQCEYAYIEMTSGGMLYRILKQNEENPSELECDYNALLNAQSPEEAALIFAASFERCVVDNGITRDSTGKIYFSDIQHSKERKDKAGEIYSEMKGRS